MKIQNALVSNILDRPQRYFTHVTTVTLSWRVQNIVVIGRVYFTLECFEFSSNFEFDRNMLSGTGARPMHDNLGQPPCGLDVSWQRRINIYVDIHTKILTYHSPVSLIYVTENLGTFPTYHTNSASITQVTCDGNFFLDILATSTKIADDWLRKKVNFQIHDV